MMKDRRGAARISVVWMIACIVVTLATIGLAAIAFQDQASSDEAAQAARAQMEVELERANDIDSEHAALTRAVGWYDEAVTTSRTEIAQLEAELQKTKETFGLGDDTTGRDTNTVQELLPLVRQEYLKLASEIDTLKSNIENLESQIQTVQTQMTQSISDKDSELADLRRQLSDAEDNAATKQAELEDRVSDLRDRNNQLDAEKRQLESDMDEARRDWQSEKLALMVRLDSQAQKLNFVEKQAQTPDGEVLTYSKDLALGWIDIGSQHRVAPGVRFRVVGGSNGEFKGWATVTNVEATMSEVQISGNPDRFNPVTTGDKLFNPLFDPKGQRFAVLAGRFSGSFNAKELGVLLDNMNISVQEDLNELTDYLIVGAEMFTDPVTKEPLEDPLPPSELAVYKDAQARGGISIIPLKDIQTYFRF